METLTAGGVEPIAISSLPRLRWYQLVGISIYWFALNVHWTALLIIILPSQVFKLVGELNKGTALAFVLIPGAFISLFANPLFGLLSDRTSGRLARWGRRRPYVVLGTLVTVAGLIWMAYAPDLGSLALSYAFVQFASNAAQAPFHALLPDVVPSDQRGLASGIMGLFTTLGIVVGVVLGGQLIDARQPQSIFIQHLRLSYALIIITLLVFMLVTIFTVHEKKINLTDELDAKKPFRIWLKLSTIIEIGATALAILLGWGIITLINEARPAGLAISSDFQQVILEMIAAVGLLRLFQFNPRRDRDFAWVLVTRLVMMLGIYTVQDFLQYYMKDVIKAVHPEQEAQNFVIIVSIASLFSVIAAGWLSDRWGRKRIVYLSGSLMALVGILFVFFNNVQLVYLAGILFGMGYGAYTSVDWALVADTLPSHQSYARDMGIWNISLSIPQLVAPVIGGPLIDNFTRAHQPIVGFQILFALAVVYCIVGTIAIRFIRSVR